MDKKEMLKRYVELMVNVVKVEQPFMDLLGTDWYEAQTGWAVCMKRYMIL